MLSVINTFLWSNIGAGDLVIIQVHSFNEAEERQSNVPVVVKQMG